MTSKIKNNLGDSNKILIDVLSRQKIGLNIVHFNARSLKKDKLDYARFIFENSKVDVIAVTETWFEHGCEDKNLEIKGYTIFRNDRLNRVGGGVAIYVKTNLTAKVISVSVDSLVEFISIEITDGTTKVLVSCVYNPSRHFSVDSFFNSLSGILIDYNFYIICGDLNINLLVDDHKTYSLKNSFTSVGLALVNSFCPTRFGNNVTPSLLDVLLVSELNAVLLYDQLSFVSDHDLIFCTLNICLNKNKSTDSNTFSFRDFKNIDYRLLFSDAMCLDWSDCCYVSNVDDKLGKLVNKVCCLYDVHVPVRTVLQRSKSCPWYSSLIIKLKNKRNNMYKKWKRDPTDLRWNLYRTARNNVVVTVRNEKTKYFNKLLNPSLSTKVLWNNLKTLHVCPKTNVTCNIDPDELNNYFLSSCETSSSTEINVDAPHNPLRNLCEFSFKSVSLLEVEKSIYKIKSNAIGDDKISIKFLKIILPFVLAPLTHIINHCITSATFPNQWKLALVTPIPKKPLAADPSLFRPISILPCLSKIFETLICNQIMIFLNDHSLLSPLQSGFRAGHSCSTAMIKILDDIRSSFDKNELILLCLLDFSKAFDSVDHSILCNKLKNNFYFASTAVKMLQSYLSNRKQTVIASGKASKTKMVPCGVPQGSILGPILFSMFINDVFDVCKNVSMHAYADDLQIYMSRPKSQIANLCSRMNSDLQSIYLWATNNKLRLNPLKSVVLPISRFTILHTDIYALCLGTSKLEFVEKVTNLGFVINNKLSCEHHIKYVVNKIYATLRNLRSTSDAVPISTKLMLVKQLIVPFINYFIVVYPKLDSQCLYTLTIALNNCTRFIYGIRRYDHLSHHRNAILGCSLENYLKIRSCIFLHNIIQHKTPGYLHNKLQWGTSLRCYNLKIPQFNFLNSSRLFFVESSRIWNSLPLDIKIINSKYLFKKSLSLFITNN